MAKKIRFALEMENGVEVRSIEELKENFSLTRVLGYLENGKLVIWLRDRYADNIADALEQINTNDKEFVKKICEIFDVLYDENVEKELVKAAERAERIKRLKQVTDEKKYLDVIDIVAFEQDELYDLLDEDVDTIYLCGERFSIPLSKSGVTYIGINNPVLLIDSKVEVDWNEIGITIEGVTFDEKYQAVLEKIDKTKEKIYDNSIEHAKKQSETLNLDKMTLDTKREIVKFLSIILEKVEELHDRDWDYQYDEICEQFEMEEIDPDDYGNNEYDYSSKSKAKHACKEQLEVIINNTKVYYAEVRNERYGELVDNIDGVNLNISEMLEDIIVEIEDYLHECDDSVAYDMINALMGKLKWGMGYDNYNLHDRMIPLIMLLLPEQVTAFKKISEYMEKCDYDEDDAMYSYNLECAAEEIVDNVNTEANNAIEKLHIGLEIMYKDIRDALGVLILKNSYEQLIIGTKTSIEKPEMLSVDELAKEIQSKDNVSGTARVLNKYTKPLLNIIYNTQEQNSISKNGEILRNIINEVDVYIKNNVE